MLKLINELFSYVSFKVKRTGVVTKVSDEIVHCLNSVIYLKKSSLTLFLFIYSVFLFICSYFLICVFEVEFSYDLLLLTYYSFWILSVFIYSFFTVSWSSIKKIPDNLVIFFYQLYILKRNPTGIYGLVLYGMFYSSVVAYLLVVSFYLLVFVFSLILDFMRFFSLINFNLVKLFISPDVMPLLNVIIEAVSKNHGFKFVFTKMWVSPATKLTAFWCGVVVFDYSSASDIGQAVHYETKRHFLEFSTGQKIPSNYQYDPNKKTLLGEFLKSNKENNNTIIKNLKE